MTNKELVELFPECEYIHKKDIESLVDKCFNELKYYNEISDLVYNYCENLYPNIKYSEDNTEERYKRNDYFFGYFDKETQHYINKFSDWINNLNIEFMHRYPSTRTYKEACKIAADKWCELLFGWHLQDNGALNEDHPGGFKACAIATIFGNEVKEKISEESKKKAYELIKTYYENDCWWEYYKDDGSYYDTWQTDLSVDYDPNRPLYDILIKSGIEDNRARLICPWKKTIRIDKRDNSVLYYTYGKKQIL